jgi:hypothetical protein
MVGLPANPTSMGASLLRYGNHDSVVILMYKPGLGNQLLQGGKLSRHRTLFIDNSKYCGRS